LDATTGTAVATASQTKVYNVSSYAGKEVPYIQVYSIMNSANEEPLTITATATDVDGNIIASQTFQNVPMQRGYSTTYKGYFFANNGTWNITVDDAYTEKDEYNF
jgi:hypothetical protein